MAAVMVLFAVACSALIVLVALTGLFLKLLFRLVLFPLFLIKWIVTSVIMLVLLPIFAIVGLAVAFAFAIVLAVPLLPLFVLGLLLWLVVTATRRPAVA